MIVLLYQTKM